MFQQLFAVYLTIGAQIPKLKEHFESDIVFEQLTMH